MRHDFLDGNGPVPARRHINPDGSEGGWVADSAEVHGSVVIDPGVKIYGNAYIGGLAKIYSEAKVFGSAHIEGNATVSGRAVVKGSAVISGNVQIYGTALIYGACTIKENAVVFGNARVYGESRIFGSAKIFGSASVFRYARISGTSYIYGSAVMGGDIRVSGDSRFNSMSLETGNYVDYVEGSTNNSNSVASSAESDSLVPGDGSDMTMTRRFGVEIELVGTTIPRVQDAFDAAGIDLVQQEYNHRTATCWKIVPDSSLTLGGFEVVSPILVGEAGLQTVRKVAAALNAAGASVDRSCGFHVHVDARDLGIDSIVQVAARYNRFENDINTFMPASRRESRYCQPISNLFENHSIERILRGGTGYLAHVDRHHKVNLAAFARHGTVEFRQHSGTVNANKMEKWVRFCLGFVAASIVVPVVEAASVEPVAAPAVPAVPVRRGRPASDKLPRLYARFQTIGMGQSIRVADLATEFGWTEATTMSSFTRLHAEYGCRIRTRFGRARMSYDPQTAERAAASRTPVRVLTLPVIENDSLFRGVADDVGAYFAARATEFTPEGLMPRTVANMEMSEAA